MELRLLVYFQHADWSESSLLDPVMFLGLWKRIGASLAQASADADFCSANGNYTHPANNL